jgi:hypothetical protein
MRYDLFEEEPCCGCFGVVLEPYSYMTGNTFIVESIKFWTLSELVSSFEAQNSLHHR